MTAIRTNGRKASSWTKRLIPKCINSSRLWPEGSLDVVTITCCVLEGVALFKPTFHVRWVGPKLGISEVLSLAGAAFRPPHLDRKTQLCLLEVCAF